MSALEVRSCDCAGASALPPPQVTPDEDEGLLARRSITHSGGNVEANSRRSKPAGAGDGPLGGSGASKIRWSVNAAPVLVRQLTCETKHRRRWGNRANGEELGETTEERKGQFQKIYWNYRKKSSDGQHLTSGCSKLLFPNRSSLGICIFLTEIIHTIKL